MPEPPDHRDPDALDRRRFLARATILIGGATAAVVAVPVAITAVAPALHAGTYYDVASDPPRTSRSTTRTPMPS